MRDAAVAIGQLIRRIAGWFGIEGAWLIAGAVFLSVWSYLRIDHTAPWAVLGVLSTVAWFALTLRRP